MAGPRVIQDSDDESNGEGSPQPADQEPLELSLDTIIDLQSSSPPRILQESGQPSTGSTERLDRELREAHNKLLEPTPDSHPSTITSRRSSQQILPSPREIKDSNRRTTVGGSEYKVKKRKRYGRTNRDGGNFYAHSEDELGESLIRGKLSQSSEEVLDNGPSLEYSAAASRVDAMLNSYNGPDVAIFGGASFSNHLGFETSIQKALVPPILKVGTGVLQSQQSDSSTWPTIPNESVKSTRNDYLATRNAASMDVPGGEREADTYMSHETASESLGSSHLNNITSFTNTNADQADIQDELSMPPPIIPRGKASTTSERQDIDHPAQSDELGSDDAAIGLPKDQYQPRPSRSRGKQNEDEIVVPETFSKRPEAVAKGKRKLKSRRKTTALARPSPKVEISDDDEHEMKLPMVAVPKLSPTPNAHILEYHIESSGGAENKQNDKTTEVVDLPIDQLSDEKVPTELNSSPKKRGRGRPKKKATEAADGLQDSYDEGDALTDEEVPTEQMRRQRKRLKTADARATIEGGDRPGDDPQHDAMAFTNDGIDNEDLEQEADVPEVQEPPPTAPKKRGRKKKAKADAMNTIADSEHENDLSDATELTSKPTQKPRGRKKKQNPISDANPTNQDAEHNDEMTDATTALPKKRGRKKYKADDVPPAKDTPPIIHPDHDADDADSDLERDENQATSKILSQSTNNAANASKPTTTEDAPAKKKTTPPITPPKPVPKPVHSPIMSSKVRFRVGLSKKARIAPLLRMVRK